MSLTQKQTEAINEIQSALLKLGGYTYQSAYRAAYYAVTKKSNGFVVDQKLEALIKEYGNHHYQDRTPAKIMMEIYQHVYANPPVPIQDLPVHTSSVDQSVPPQPEKKFVSAEYAFNVLSQGGYLIVGMGPDYKLMHADRGNNEFMFLNHYLTLDEKDRLYHTEGVRQNRVRVPGRTRECVMFTNVKKFLAWQE